MQDLASRLLTHVKNVRKHHDCKILVTNFLLPDGDTSLHGMELADQVSQLLASDGKKISVVARAPLQEMFVKDRLRSRDMTSNDEQRWLGSHLGADVVLLGRTVPLGEGMVRLSAHFLAASEKDKVGPDEEVNLTAPASAQDLTPRELYSALPRFDTSQFHEKVYRSGVKGAPIASCYYMPNPSYADDARRARFSGTILLEAVVDTDGSVKAPRIVQGACCGLNESALRTMSLWKWKPPAIDGTPVPVVVSFEVTFRLY